MGNYHYYHVDGKGKNYTCGDEKAEGFFILSEMGEKFALCPYHSRNERQQSRREEGDYDHFVSVTLSSRRRGLLLKGEEQSVNSVAHGKTEAGEKERKSYPLLFLRSLRFLADQPHGGNYDDDANGVESYLKGRAPRLVPAHNKRGNNGNKYATGDIEHHNDGIRTASRRAHDKKVIPEQGEGVQYAYKHAQGVKGEAAQGKAEEGYDYYRQA